MATSIPMESTPAPAPTKLTVRIRKSPWPLLTEVVLIIYALLLMVYLAWPFTLFNIDINTWPFLSLFMMLSIAKILVPLFGVFLATMHVTYPDLLGLFVSTIILASVDSLVIIVFLVIHMILANTGTGEMSYGNDARYCCQFAGMVPSCPASYGPCAGFAGPLALNSDIIVLMVFQCLLLFFELLCLVFMIGLYNTHVDKSKKMSWKKMIGSNSKEIVESIVALPAAMPIWLQQIQQNLQSMVYGNNISKLAAKKHGKIE